MKFMGRAHAVVVAATAAHEPAVATVVDVLAQQAHADFVALGTQHHTLMERLLVGSVATKVLRTARIPVLAVPRV